MKHRILSLLLALVFLLSVFLFSTTAFAASNTADGLTAVLESDKDAYVAGDNVGVSLTVTNTSEDITNIRTELIVPQGLDLVEGQLISDAVNLTVGESAQYSYVLSVPVVEVPTTAVPTTQTPTTQPDTGDESPETRDITMLIYGSVAVLALVGLMVLAFGGKLMKQRWFVLLICASLLLGVLAPVAASAAVAEKSFEVTKAITIDGNAAEILLESTNCFTGQRADVAVNAAAVIAQICQQVLDLFVVHRCLLKRCRGILTDHRQGPASVPPRCAPAAACPPAGS